MNKSSDFVFSGQTVDEKRMEILELPDYFFIATQFHPEFKSRPDPAFYGFIKATLDKKRGETAPSFKPEISAKTEARFLPTD